MSGNNSKKWLRDNCVPVVAVCVLLAVIAAGTLFVKSRSGSAEIARLNASLAERDSASDEKLMAVEQKYAGELAALKDEKAKVTQELCAASEDIQRTMSEYESARARIEELEGEAAAREKSLIESHQAVSDDSITIRILQEDLEKWKASAAVVEAKASSADAEATRLKTELATAAVTLNSLKASSAQDAAEIAGYKAEIYRLRSLASESENELRRLSEAVSADTKISEDASAEIARLRSVAEGANSEIDKLNGAIAERNTAIADGKAEIELLNKRLAGANTEIERLSAQLAESDSAIAAASSDARVLSERMEAAGKTEEKLLEGLNSAIEKLWVDGYITAAHALATEAGAKFPDHPEFADTARQLRTLLDAMSGDPNALPDVIPQ